MPASRTVLRGAGLLGGMGVAGYSLFTLTHWTLYLLPVPNPPGEADRAWFRSVYYTELVRHEPVAIVGVVAGGVLALVTALQWALSRGRGAGPA